LLFCQLFRLYGKWGHGRVGADMSKILVIDDDPQVRELLSRVLKREGYDLCVAADGDEGLEVTRNERPDLVITDIFMPEREGLSTIMELKRIRPGIGIIAISGGGHIARGDYLDAAVDMGANVGLAKPLDLKHLRATVARLLEAGPAPVSPRVTLKTD